MIPQIWPYTNQILTPTPAPYDIILHCEPGLGFLPIIQRDGKEIYRGEYAAHAHEALVRALSQLAMMNI